MSNNNRKTNLPLILVYISLIPFSTSTIISTIITLPLSHFTKYSTNPFNNNVYEHFNHLATTSLSRAYRLKNPNSDTVTTSTAPLSPHSYGAYSVSLAFGTPPQSLPFVMDTGSSFVWSPCTRRYICSNCYFPNSYPIPVFLPKLSSTVKLVGCSNPKCGWIFDDLNTESRCTRCTNNPSNCTCPPYTLQYGSGFTGGIALFDTLDLNYEKVPGFILGCSILSIHQPAGIAGFGRANTSLPSQLGLTKFSYCSLSHIFDDTNLTSSLNLIKGNPGSTAGVSYTRFAKNPRITSREVFSEYYYVRLNKILVGGKKVKLNGDYLSPPDDVTGDGGTIIDSGTTFTYMAREIFEPLARAIDGRMRAYKRVEAVERISGLRPCFNISGVKTVPDLDLEFHFKGGAKMALPIANYFSFVGTTEVVCLTIVTDGADQVVASGPRVILGGYQQQNFYVEYDLKHNKFGFKPQKCA